MTSRRKKLLLRYSGGGAPASSLLDGLIHVWHLDEAGTTTSDLRVDSVGNVDLTPSGALVTQLAGKQGLAYTQNGAQVRLQADSQEMRNLPLGSFTFSCWFRTSTNDPPNSLISIWDNQNDDRSFLLQVQTGDEIRFSASPSGATPLFNADSQVVWASNTWYHCVCGYNKDAGNIFISVDNEALVTTDIPSINISDFLFVVGTIGPQLANQLKGRIDELYCWNRVLTPEERAELYNDGVGKFYPFSQPPYVFSDEYIAFRNYLESQSIPLPSTAGQQADDQLIKDLKDAGLWDEVDAIWNFTTEGVADYALVNLKNPGTFTATLHGTVSPSYVAKEGFYGNAAQEAYINHNWVPNNSSIFLQDDASIHVYTTDDTQSNDNLVGTTNASANGRAFVLNKDSTDRAQGYLNSNSGIQVEDEGGPGLFSVVREESSSHQLYKNGVQIGTDTDNSNGRSQHPLIGLGWNNNGTPTGFQDKHLGLVIVGSSALNPAALNTIWDNHLLRIAGL